MFRDYNPEKEKRFNSTTQLHYKTKTNLNICVIGSVKHIDEAKAVNIPYIDLDGLKKFNNEAKAIKKFARKYDVLLVSDTIAKNVTKLVGKHLSSVRKLPIQVSENEKLVNKQDELLKTIKFQVKKYPWVAQSIGTVDLAPEEIQQNATKALNFLVSLLPKGWQNLKSVHIKTTMGKPVSIY
jgi:large subunit ribosomal protein L10Ae